MCISQAMIDSVLRKFFSQAVYNIQILRFNIHTIIITDTKLHNIHVNKHFLLVPGNKHNTNWQSAEKQ